MAQRMPQNEGVSNITILKNLAQDMGFLRVVALKTRKSVGPWDL